MWCQPLICAQSASTTVDPSVCMSFGLSLSHFLFGYLTTTFLFPVLSLNPEKSWMQYSRGIQCLPANSHLAAVSKVRPSLAINTNRISTVFIFIVLLLDMLMYKYIFYLWPMSLAPSDCFCVCWVCFMLQHHIICRRTWSLYTSDNCFGYSICVPV